MEDDQLLRFSRHIMLPSIGIDGQERLINSQVLIIGLGGLGSPVSMYLAASGVGKLVLADFDVVDLTNLQRQIVHTSDRIGTNKAESAKQALLSLNPGCKITAISRKLATEELGHQVANADLVVDCSDNFTTRFAINSACVANRTPLISGAVIRMEGQVSVFTGQPGEPCYHCLYGDGNEVDETCTGNGILAPIAGIIGSIQATEAIKILADIGTALNGKLLLLDALHMEWRTLRLQADPKCPVCSGRSNQ